MAGLGPRLPRSIVDSSAARRPVSAAGRYNPEPRTGMSTPELLLSLKPIISALILPPTPWLLCLLLAVCLALTLRRKTAAALALLAAAGLWLSCCMGTAVWLEQAVVRPPTPLSLQTLQGFQAPSLRGQTAIVVLGAGLDLEAPEYGQPSLTRPALMRLRYGVWLARRSGLPLAFSGGVGWAQQSSVSEAEVAARIAREEWQQPIHWQETRSRDTRENARWTVALLKEAGIRHVILVTHAYHMPRSLRAFEEASGGQLQLTPAPIGYAAANERPIMNWLPTTSGYTQVYDLLHEIAGWWAGA